MGRLVRAKSYLPWPLPLSNSSQQSCQQSLLWDGNSSASPLFAYNPSLVLSEHPPKIQVMSVRISSYSFCSTTGKDPFARPLRTGASSRHGIVSTHQQRRATGLSPSAQWAVFFSVPSSIPLHAQSTRWHVIDQAQDPRWFMHKGELCALFVRREAEVNESYKASRVWLFRTGVQPPQETLLKLSGERVEERNWVLLLEHGNEAVLTPDGRLLVVYSLCMTRISACGLGDGLCEFAYEADSVSACANLLRPSTSFQRLPDEADRYAGFFLGVTHAKRRHAPWLFPNSTKTRSRGVRYDHAFVILNSTAPYNVVAVSRTWRFPSLFGVDELDDVQFAMSMSIVSRKQREWHVVIGYGVGDCHALAISRPLSKILGREWHAESDVHRQLPRAPAFEEYSAPHIPDMRSRHGPITTGRTSTTVSCGVVWFVHIPKTGGTTVKGYLAQLAALSSRSSTPWRLADLHRGEGWMGLPDEVKWDERRWNEAIDWHQTVKNELAKPQPRLLVHQHTAMPGFGAYTVRRVLQPLACELQTKGCRLLVATILREPVSRIRSEVIYIHALLTGKMGRAFFVNASMPFDIEGIFQGLGKDLVDVQSKYLLFGNTEIYHKGSGSKLRRGYGGDGDDGLLAGAALRALSHVDLIGFSDDLDGFLSKIEAAIGVHLPRKGAVRANRSPSHDAVYATAFGPSADARFVLASRRDLEVWNHTRGVATVPGTTSTPRAIARVVPHCDE